MKIQAKMGGLNWMKFLSKPMLGWMEGREGLMSIIMDPLTSDLKPFGLTRNQGLFWPPKPKLSSPFAAMKLPTRIPCQLLPQRLLGCHMDAYMAGISPKTASFGRLGLLGSQEDRFGKPMLARILVWHVGLIWRRLWTRLDLLKSENIWILWLVFTAESNRDV